MNRTIKEATVKRFYYDNHQQLKQHLYDFINAYNFAKRLKALKGLTPYEFIIKTWTSDLNKFIINPNHYTLGLNTIIISLPHLMMLKKAIRLQQLQPH